MPDAQFLSLPWNLNVSDPKGNKEAHGVPVHAIAGIDVSSFADAKNGRGYNITLHFNNGALSIQSKGNAVEVLETIHQKRTGGLTEHTVSFQQHRYLETSTGGIGQGWVPEGEPEVMSVPDFLKRTV